MGRKKAEFPSIVHLKVLMELYYRLHPALKYARNESGIDFLDELGISLAKDKIGNGTSKNLLYKLIGMPFHSTPEQCEGIDTETLHAIAKRVIEGFMIKIPEEDIAIDKYHWWIFNKVFTVPATFKQIQIKKYYKFLSDEEKNTVDRFVYGKVSELISSNDGSNDIVAYCAYFWDEVDRVVQTAILTINKPFEQADLHYVNKNVDDIHVRQETTKQGGTYFIDRSTCFLSFIDIDGREYLRTSLYFSAHASDFFSPAYVKGTYASIKRAGESPVAGTMLIEKKNSYAEALEFLRTTSPSDEIYLEIKDQRIVVPSTKLRVTSEFDTARTANLLAKRISGAYILAFIKRPEEIEELTITKGICFIKKNGETLMQVSGSDLEVSGHISTEEFEDGMFSLINLYGKAHFSFKYRYYLKPRKLKDSTKIQYLEGVYAGIEKTHPRAGEILFIKKDFSSFEELKRAEPPIYLTKENISKEEDKYILDYLTTKSNVDRGYLIDAAYANRQIKRYTVKIT